MNWMFVMVVGALAVACGNNGDSGDAPPPHAREAVTDGGTWTVAYTPSPDPIPGNAEFALDITIDDAAGPAAGTSIVLTAEMPAHGHGMNVTPVVTGEDGLFRADGMLFHMTWEWRMYVDVTGDDGTETAELWVTCCES